VRIAPVPVANRGACGADAPARFGARNLHAMHGYPAPCIPPLAWMRSPESFRITCARHTVARHRTRAACVAVEHLAIGRPAFPGSRRRLPMHARASVPGERTLRRRPWAARWTMPRRTGIDQRQSRQAHFRLSRMRRAGCVPECDPAVRGNALVDRSGMRLTGEAQQSGNRAREQRPVRH